MDAAAIKVRYRVEGMGVPGAVDRIQAALRGLPGVLRVRTDPVPAAAAPGWAGTVTITITGRGGFPDAGQLEAALQDAGCPRVQRL